MLTFVIPYPPLTRAPACVGARARLPRTTPVTVNIRSFMLVTRTRGGATFVNFRADPRKRPAPY